MVRYEVPIRYARGITGKDRAANCVRFSPPASFAAGPGGPSGKSDPGAPDPASSAPGGSGPPNPLNRIGVAVDKWVVSVRALLEDVQKTLEHAHDSAVGEDRRDLSRLLARVRECRAEVPGPDMVAVWLRFLLGLIQ